MSTGCHQDSGNAIEPTENILPDTTNSDLTLADLPEHIFDLFFELLYYNHKTYFAEEEEEDEAFQFYDEKVRQSENKLVKALLEGGLRRD